MCCHWLKLKGAAAVCTEKMKVKNNSLPSMWHLEESEVFLLGEIGIKDRGPWRGLEVEGKVGGAWS